MIHDHAKKNEATTAKQCFSNSNAKFRNERKNERKKERKHRWENWVEINATPCIVEKWTDSGLRCAFLVLLRESPLRSSRIVRHCLVKWSQWKEEVLQENLWRDSVQTNSWPYMAVLIANLKKSLNKCVGVGERYVSWYATTRLLTLN